jgi:tRNA A-37 threonylcarbamoyl transferase component Bud32
MDMRGTTIDGKFKVLRPLGSGGMGAVYEAEQIELGRIVAIKFLNDPNMAEEEAFARFQQEAQIISQLMHKNIVAVYAFGQWRDMPYMAMERVQGTSVQEMLKENKPLAQGFVLNLAMQVCAGLHQAHEAGVVHRDIKPSNLIVAESGEVKIIDFGFAKLVGPNSGQRQQLTEAGAAVGSVLYMSPEQCTGSKVDRRSDIYALGCVLHHCFTGVPPFSGDHSVVVMMQHTQEPAPRLAKVCPGLEFNPSIQTLLDVAMSKPPDARYQNAEEMRADVESISKGGSISRLLVTTPASQSAKQTRRSVLLQVSIAAVTAVLAAGAAFFCQRYFNSAPQTVAGPDTDVAALTARVEELELRARGVSIENLNPEDALQLAELNYKLTRIEDRFLVLRSNNILNYVKSAIMASKTPEEKLAAFKRGRPLLSTDDGGEEMFSAFSETLRPIQELQDAGRYKRARKLWLEAFDQFDSKHGPGCRQAVHLIMFGLLKCDLQLQNQEFIDRDIARCKAALTAFPPNKFEEIRRIQTIADQMNELGRHAEGCAIMADLAEPLLSFVPADDTELVSPVYVWTAVPVVNCLYATNNVALAQKLVEAAEKWADRSNDPMAVATAYSAAMGIKGPGADDNARKAIARLKKLPAGRAGAAALNASLMRYLADVKLSKAK